MDAAGWPRRKGLDADLSAIGVTLNAMDSSLLQSVSDHLTRGEVDEAKSLVPPWSAGEDSGARNTFSFLISRQQGKSLFERIRPDYEAVLKQRLGEEVLQALAGSQELAVLFSLAYNSPGLIGPSLTAALRDGARERAWYEIRFGSNRERHRGLQNRRDREAALFGALNAAPSAAERAAFLQLIEDRRARMTRYLGEVGLSDSQIQTTLADLEANGRETRLA